MKPLHHLSGHLPEGGTSSFVAKLNPERYPLQDGHILTWVKEISHPEHLSFEATIDVVFGKGTVVEGKPIVPTLDQFIGAVEQVLTRF
ncbi:MULTISPECIES: hypothetical protein [unclassified Mesorhizobium]|uniref:hypothetical protein n=1 Tax=unclassified Mesorhizobium TaxID=325217 RepID=UPI000FD38B71|nr:MULTISPECIES: hypothetical protein [unclassified Mesorhizobium]RVB72129.1 hypothetical protein EN885_30245 [Mesorhizobium sp. M6A.T.Cr.TU.014.01.1.1]RWP96416.1 MAG: hypothetical protein EOR90_30010 [Mesorhizobium sp.]RWQ01486.1 MAG: hypothetical protein EOR91_23375 [Mesorhizobium sp.]